MDKLIQDVGASVIDATKDNQQAIINTARTIAAFCEAKAANLIPLIAGDKDILPGLHAALGAGINAGSELHKAQLRARQLAKRLGIAGWDSDVPSCPCAEGGISAKTALVLVPFNREAAAA